MTTRGGSPSGYQTFDCLPGIYSSHYNDYKRGSPSGCQTFDCLPGIYSFYYFSLTSLLISILHQHKSVWDIKIFSILHLGFWFSIVLIKFMTKRFVYIIIKSLNKWMSGDICSIFKILKFLGQLVNWKDLWALPELSWDHFIY